MNRYTCLAAVLFFSLACTSTGHTQLAVDECTPDAETSACERCFMTNCSEQCMNCVDDPACYACGEGGVSSPECADNEEIGLFLTCIITAPCQTECAGQPPVDPTKPPKVGRRKGAGRGGGGGGGGDKGGGGGGGGGGGKAGKGGKGH